MQTTQTMQHLKVVQEPNSNWHPPRHCPGKADPVKIVHAFFDYFRGRPTESCVAVALNSGWEIIGWTEVASGTVNSAGNMIVGNTVRFALLAGACSVVLLHSHPTAKEAEPSPADDACTVQLDHACKMLELKLLDHLIVGAKSFFSYRTAGRL